MATRTPRAAGSVAAPSTVITMPTYAAALVNEDGRTIEEVWFRIILALINRTGGLPGLATPDITHFQATLSALSAAISGGTFLLEKPDAALPAALQLLAETPLKLTVGDGQIILSVSLPLAVAQGGTGAKDAADARENLGLGTLATQNADTVEITGGTAQGLTLDGLTVNAQASTAAPAAGSAAALPATPAGYLLVTINGSAQWLPYY